MTEHPEKHDEDELQFGLGHSASPNENTTTECANCAKRLNADETYYTIRTHEYQGGRAPTAESVTNLCPACFNELPTPVSQSLDTVSSK